MPGSPPPGIEEGGIWGTNKYIGTTTQGAACLGCLCLGVPGCLALCFPCDERDAYKVKGKVRQGGSLSTRRSLVETNDWKTTSTFTKLTILFLCINVPFFCTNPHGLPALDLSTTSFRRLKNKQTNTTL